MTTTTAPAAPCGGRRAAHASARLSDPPRATTPAIGTAAPDRAGV